MASTMLTPRVVCPGRCASSRRFGLARAKLRQGLRVWAHNNPAQHAEYASGHVLQSPHWHVSQSLAALEVLTPADVEAFLRSLPQALALEVLAYGNVSAQEARGEEAAAPAGACLAGGRVIARGIEGS